MDISDLHKELNELKEHLDAFFRETESFGVFRVIRDDDSSYLAKTALVSPSVEKLLGADPYIVESWFAPIHQDDIGQVMDAQIKSANEGCGFDQTFRFLHPVRKKILWYRAISNPVRTWDKSGYNCFNGILIDVTEEMELRLEVDRLKYQSQHDPLTGLMNRHALQLLFDSHKNSAIRHERSMALLYIDIDNFKSVNDKMGHIFGDHCLKQVADGLSGVLRSNEHLFRVGGDEFCILISEFVARSELTTLSKRLIDVIQNFSRSANMDVDIGASIGISTFPDDAGTLDELMSLADLAMYQVKSLSKNSVTFYQR